MDTHLLTHVADVSFLRAPVGDLVRSRAMTHTLALLVVLTGSTLAWAQPDKAAEQIRERLRSEWQSVVDAAKSVGWQVQVQGRRYEGDWVVHLGGWTYLFAQGTVRCRMSGSKYLSCDDKDFVETVTARIAINTDPQRAPTLADVRMLQRGIFGKGLAVGANGKAVIETIVSTPNAEIRTSRRYQASATFTERGFAIDAPRLVEAYREQCYAVHGCHTTHLSCVRVR